MYLNGTKITFGCHNYILYDYGYILWPSLVKMHFLLSDCSQMVFDHIHLHLVITCVSGVQIKIMLLRWTSTSGGRINHLIVNDWACWELHGHHSQAYRHPISSRQEEVVLLYGLLPDFRSTRSRKWTRVEERLVSCHWRYINIYACVQCRFMWSSVIWLESSHKKMHFNASRKRSFSKFPALTHVQ